MLVLGVDLDKHFINISAVCFAKKSEICVSYKQNKSNKKHFITSFITRIFSERLLKIGVFTHWSILQQF